jgi:hypothetical protein
MVGDVWDVSIHDDGGGGDDRDDDDDNLSIVYC